MFVIETELLAKSRTRALVRARYTHGSFGRKPRRTFIVFVYVARVAEAHLSSWLVPSAFVALFSKPNRTTNAQQKETTITIFNRPGKQCRQDNSHKTKLVEENIIIVFLAFLVFTFETKHTNERAHEK